MATFCHIGDDMEEPADRIIVFESYDTVTAANLVKTKLDAYGIPCFLSDEHFVNLYPIRNELFPGVRLHIFEKDKERVIEILKEESSGTETEVIYCPSCQSADVKLEETKKGLLADFLSTLLSGLFLHPKKVYRCQACNHTFEMHSEVSKSSTP